MLRISAPGICLKLYPCLGILMTTRCGASPSPPHLIGHLLLFPEPQLLSGSLGMLPRRTEGFCWLEAIVSPGNFWKLAVVWGVGQADGVLPGSAGSVKQSLDPASFIPRPLLFFFPTQLTASSRRQVDTTFLGDDIAQEPIHPSSEGLRAQHDCS